MVNRTFILTIIAIMLIIAAAAISAGCSHENSPPDGETDMTVTLPRIPPIDAVTPLNWETATLASG